MDDVYLAIRILLLIISLGFGYTLYILIHNIMAEKGIKTPLFNGHIDHLLDFSSLIERTENKKEQKYFKTILRAFYGLSICFICTALTFIIDLKNSPCKLYDSLKEQELNGVVVKKYINTSHHNMSKLVLNVHGDLREETFLPLHYHGLYDSAQIGDVVVKVKGDSAVMLVRGQASERFLVPKQRFCSGN